MKNQDLRQRALDVLLPLVALGFMTLLMELLLKALRVPSYLVPPPSEVLQSLSSEKTTYLNASIESFSSSFLGFLGSFVVGLFLAFVLSLNESLRRIFHPISVFFQTVPVIAVAPLLVIWFGFGAPTVRASAFIVSFFPILAGGLAGLSQVPRESRELFQMLGASRLQRLLKLEIPSSIPSVLTGARVAAGLSVVGAIVGEFIAGTGLGSLIDSARTQQRTEIVFAAIFCSTLLGLLMIALVEILGLALSRYRNWISN